MLKGAGESAVVAPGGTAVNSGNLVVFGLLANYVGGVLDDIKDENNIGIWRGPDAVFELLAPAFDDTGLAGAYTTASPGQPVPLYAGTDGRLVYISSPGSRPKVADLISRDSAAKIVIDLKV
jgi:hypothetical protein